MVTQPMKHAVRIGGISRSSQRDQRTYGRRLAFEGKLVEQVLVYVGVKGGIVFQQIFATALDVHDLRTLQFQADAQIYRNNGAHIYVLNVRRESLTCNQHVV